MEINNEYFDQKLAEIPKDFLFGAVNFLKNDLSHDEKHIILERYKEKGLIDWIEGEHHGWGMSIRNALRTEGFTDDQLPDGNWDDYYIQVVEIAVGIRDFPEWKNKSGN